MRLPLSSHRAHFFACGVIAAMLAGCITARQPQPAEQHNHAAVAALGPGFTSQTVHVNGTTIHYVRGGSGPEVLLLHGFPQDWYEWHHIMPRLSKRFTVVAADLRGIGGSEPTQDGYEAPDARPREAPASPA
jgi:alpha-beta hydrolase superfamily lysophospholipase